MPLLAQEECRGKTTEIICGQFTLEYQTLHWQGFLNNSENVIYSSADLLCLNPWEMLWMFC